MLNATYTVLISGKEYGTYNSRRKALTIVSKLLASWVEVTIRVNQACIRIVD